MVASVRPLAATAAPVAMGMAGLAVEWIAGLTCGASAKAIVIVKKTVT